MTRLAVVIANSVASQPTQRGMRPSRVRRTAKEVDTLLSRLPRRYAFTVKRIVDAEPAEVRRKVSSAARRCTGQGSLLLVYYFGHARREADALAFVHPSTVKGGRSSLAFASLFHTIMAEAPAKVLFLLDCCYAGAAEREFDFNTGRKHHCLMACTTPSTRAFFEQGLESPIGSFTRAVIEGLSSPRATTQNGNEITVDTLFAFAKTETERRTAGKQRPYMQGTLGETLSIYLPRPIIIPGITAGLSPKCGYSKVMATVVTIGKRRHTDIQSLYRSVTTKYRDEFLTNSRDESGRPKLANWTALRRYVSFLRAVGVIDKDELMLTTRGLDLIDNPESHYNARLRVFLTRYLESQNGLTIQELRDAMQRVIQRRWIPTREHVLQDLPPTKSNYINEGHMALVLDLLGCIGEIGTLRKREQVYFPWIAPARIDDRY